MKDFLGIGAAFSAMIKLGKYAMIFVACIILGICGLIQEGYRSISNSDMFYPKYEIYVCEKYNEEYALPGVTASDEDRLGLKVRYNENECKVFYWDNMTQKMKDEFIDLGGVEERGTEDEASLNE